MKAMGSAIQLIGAMYCSARLTGLRAIWLPVRRHSETVMTTFQLSIELECSLLE